MSSLQTMRAEQKRVYNYLLTHQATNSEVCRALNIEYRTAYYHLKELLKKGMIFKSEQQMDGGYIYSASIKEGFKGKVKLHRFEDHKLDFQLAVTAIFPGVDSQLGDIFGYAHDALCSLACRARWPQQFNDGPSHEIRHLEEFRKHLEALLKLLDSIIQCGVVSDPEQFLATIGESNWGYLVRFAKRYEDIRDNVVTEVRDFQKMEKYINSTYVPDPDVVEELESE